MEIEAKFTLPDLATYQKLSALTAIGDYAIGISETYILSDHYFDSATQCIQQAGYYLRVRRVADNYTVTLKSLPNMTEGAIHRREEHNFALSQYRPFEEWPINPVTQRISSVLMDEALETVLQLKQTRTILPVIKDDEVIAELSLDIVNQQVGEHRQTYYEMEIEITEAGSEQNLTGIITKLHPQFPLTPQTLSKYQRGMAFLKQIRGEIQPASDAQDEQSILETLATLENSYGRRARAIIALQQGATQVEAGEAAGLSERRVRYWLAEYRERGLAIFPDKILAQITPALVVEKEIAEDETVPPVGEIKTAPGLSPDDTMAEAARKTLKFHFDAMLAREAGTRIGKDIEELHEMRVATRRMRSAFRVFRGYYNPEKMAAHIAGVKLTGGVLGTVRDMDVYEEKTKKYVSGAGKGSKKPDLKPMMKAWNSAHKQARDELINYLDGAEYQKFVRSFGKTLNRSFEGKKAKSSKTKPRLVRHVVPVLIYQRLAEVRCFDEWMQKKNVPLTRYHELRIATKYLRYTLEFFQEVLGPEAAEAIVSLKQFQNHLGDLQDAIVASGRLRNFWIWGTWDSPTNGKSPKIDTAPLIAPDVASYHAAKQQEILALLAEFPAVWQEFTHSDFSQLISKAVSGL